MEASGASKSIFSEKKSQYHFFELQCETFVRIFHLDKVYSYKNPSGYLYLRQKSFPEMHSNQNLNAWSAFKFKFKILNFTNRSQTLKMKISLHPYYSPSWDETSCSTSHFEYWRGPAGRAAAEIFLK